MLQGKSTRREWDLSRPDAKKLDVPARLGDDDPRCGPASLQRFAGEDLTVSDSHYSSMHGARHVVVAASLLVHTCARHSG